VSITTIKNILICCFINLFCPTLLGSYSSKSTPSARYGNSNKKTDGGPTPDVILESTDELEAPMTLACVDSPQDFHM
jgi:hypothetical protein